MALGELAFRLFGWYVRKREYPNLQNDLRRARMPTSADTYVASAIFSAVFMCILGGVFGFLISWFFEFELIFTLTLAVLFIIIFWALTYKLILTYPAMSASDRARKVDAALPYSIGFMHALSRSGASIVDIFSELSTRDDVGELKKEAQYFMRDVKYLGTDPLTALRNLARTTPSEKFRSFLEVLVSIIETGGDTTPFFSAKTFELHNFLKEENKKTISSLEFMAELFVIIIAFAPLLFLSIFLFMGLLPGQIMDIRLFWLIVYAWVPLGAFVFAVIISTTSRERIRGRPRILRFPSPYRDVSLVAGGPKDKVVLRQLKGTFWRARLKRFIANPFRMMVRAPSYILFFSIPAAVIYLLFIVSAIDTSAIFITFLIAALPYAIVYEFRSRKVDQIESALPDFLKSLSSASSSGLTLSRSLAVASSAELGPLTDEIRQTRKELSWGKSTSEALVNLEKRVGVSDVAARATTLIKKASEAEENVSDVVDIVTDDVETERLLKKERGMSMFIYKVIVILVFGVFIITSFFIIDSFLSSGIQPPAGITTTDIKVIFYHLLMIEGLVTGLIAGQMGGGDLRSGLKYAILMMIIVWIFFSFYVMPKPVTIPVPME